ncbi:MAG: YbhB/YbcL family Raf kinase inhibitor-like protein [Candidatus Omnitrophica bacterium]|nr:YbhB/YbcL family Raf kinase inhibitor-like protein [Candidatus Omnitrophota bacterium]
MALELKCSSFKSNEEIPLKHTYNNENLSPWLIWSDVPPGTRSFALICDDPDAPVKTWVHWVIFNIPEETRELKENLPNQEILDNGAIQGVNDFGEIGYSGPSPPPGTVHRYIFKLYALDTTLNLKPKATKDDLLKAMKDHAIGEARLIGIFGR